MMGNFDDVCRSERDAALRRIQLHYSRDPHKRRETQQPVVDDVEKTSLVRRLPAMALTEFSFTWNGRMGELP
jgi:hypothetical protein